MADIRIKDLATLESASLTGDVFVIDGTTGTRKLSAFSPTFGGNATVTGTLTANNTFTATGGMVSTYGTAPQFSIAPSGGRPIRFNASLGNISIQANSGGWYLGTHFLGSAGTHRGSIWASGTDDSLDFISIGDGSFSQWLSTSSTKIAIPLTTVSTTTSSGALVVGNGTSGGLGVGGALNVGGQIRAQLGLFAGSPPTGLASAYQVDVDAGTSRDILSWGDSSRVGLIRGEQDGSGRATLKFGRYTASTFAEYFRVTGLAATDAIVSIYGTTASTSTSSGALVVSGGVGVAGAIFAGGNIQCNAVYASNNTTLYLRPQGATVSSGEAQLTTTGNFTLAGTLTAGGTITSTNGSGSGLLGMRSSSGNASYVFWSETGVADRGILGFNNGSSTLSYRSFSSSFSTGTEVFSITSGGNVTAGGSVQTSAPSGGTAAAWKLGTVATVSPTSPNRTIEVDIGGTIYYIHAKTTNN